MKTGILNIPEWGNLNREIDISFSDSFKQTTQIQTPKKFIPIQKLDIKVHN